jgi:hypothetical protein
VLEGLTQNTHIGLESNQYYSATNFFGSMPIANLKYICSDKHHFGLKFGFNNHSESYTKTDSLTFFSFLNTTKLNRSIPVNPNSDGYSEDKNSINNKNFAFIPFYEYHFKGSKRWDYYIGAEYILDFSINPKGKNTEDLVYTNSVGDKIEYTYRSKKATFMKSHGLIVTGGVNYFIFNWLSIGTKISASKQASYFNPNTYVEKLTINGVDKTGDLPKTNPNIKDYKSSNTFFLNGSNGGFITNFFLPLMINFYF